MRIIWILKWYPKCWLGHCNHTAWIINGRLSITWMFAFSRFKWKRFFLSVDIFACGSADSSALWNMWDFQFRLIIIINYYYSTICKKQFYLWHFFSNGMFNLSLIYLLLLPHHYDVLYYKTIESMTCMHIAHGANMSF